MQGYGLTFETNVLKAPYFQEVETPSKQALSTRGVKLMCSTRAAPHVYLDVFAGLPVETVQVDGQRGKRRGRPR